MRDLEKVLSEKLDQFKWSGGDWAGSRCPFPDHNDSGPSFRINLARGFFYCFGCQRSGSIAELMALLGLPATSIERLLKTIKFLKEIKREKHVEVLPEYILAAFKRCPKELLAAGFKKNVLEENGVGFDLTRYAITYPLRDKDGVLRAVYRRTDNPDYKYLVYDFDNFEGYVPLPKKHLWGLHKVFAKYMSGGKSDPLVITEGFKACLWVMQHGWDSIATMGTALTDDQASLISLVDPPTLLMFDNDQAGLIGAARAYKKLRNRVTNLKFCVYSKEKKQPDDLTKEELDKSVSEPKNFAEWRNECRTEISSTDLIRAVLPRKEKRY